MLNKLIMIWYFPGMRGNAVLRILSAHAESYWNAKLQQIGAEFISHPLDLPNLQTNINIDANAYLNSKLSKLKFSYSTYHTIGHVDGISTKKLIKDWITSRAFTNKYLFIFDHCKNINPTNHDLLVIDNKPHIWLFGTRDRLGMKLQHYVPSTNPQAYNLNIDALFSKDYITFESEYFKLIDHFNLTSELNRVRAFILLTLEREDYISKFY